MMVPARHVAGAGETREESEIMDWDELQPEKKKPEPKNLEVLSIEALGEYIAELEAEIARVRETIRAKEAARSGADQFFKS